MVASTLISILCGGVETMADGLVLLGTFVAGDNDYSASVPYLILAYALIPAMAEELLLRGVVISRIGKMGFASAAIVSAVLSGFMSFSLGGFLPAVFAALMMCFVLYTTGSLWACMIVRLLFNLYRLFFEVNVSAYYVSSTSRGLLIVVIVAAVLLFGALFFGESARIYRDKAERIESGQARSASAEPGRVMSDIKKTLSYRPSVVLFAICAAIFVAVTVIGYLA